MKHSAVGAGKRIASLLAAIVFFAALLGGPPMAAGQGITVVVNGQQLQFDQPPVERSGRVFVPLRGVFEKLGASVVYDNGVINATANGTTVQLRIGSVNALVNGNTQQLDVAPFEIGARTFVPLRFISQALGASVNWDDNSRTVSIYSSGQNSTISLTSLRPASGAVVSSNSPAVSGSFSSAVDPNSVRITLDSRDVSSTTDISSSGFLFTPGYSLIPGSHTVRVTGRATNGINFDQSWSFTSGATASSNYVTNLSPSNGSTVGNTFTISGTTLPNSTVHVVVTPQAVFGGMFTVSTGTYVTDVHADGSGNFQQTVNVTTASGGTVSVRLTSIAPHTGASKTVDLSLKS